MLRGRSEQIRLCYERAAEAKQRAEETTDPDAKADFLNMERRWLLSARAYHVGEGVGDFACALADHLPKLSHAFDPYSILQASGAAIFAKDKGSRLIAVNSACLNLVGKSWNEIRGRNDGEWHLDRAQARNVLANDQLVIESEQAQVYEESFNTPLGSRIILSTKAPLCDQGEIVGIVGVAKDITERKKREEETELLYNELSHRLRNSLALIQAVARQTVKRGDGLYHFEQRLLAYARSQKLVLEHRGRGVLLRELINAHWSAFNVRDRVSVEGADVVLNPHFATQIGIALHELATNSVKYGALGGHGRVEVRWALEGVDEQRQYLALNWHEMHGRLQGQPAHRGFGHEVLTRIIPARLNAVASLEISIGELRWTLRAELKD